MRSRTTALSSTRPSPLATKLTGSRRTRIFCSSPANCWSSRAANSPLLPSSRVSPPESVPRLCSVSPLSVEAGAGPHHYPPELAPDGGGLRADADASRTEGDPGGDSGKMAPFRKGVVLTGSLVAIVTPMQPGGALDLAAYRRLIDFHVANGTSAIVAVGTTGESPTVDVEEHCLLIKTAVEHAAGRIPVIAGTGANSTAEAIELAGYAREVGAQYGL